MSLVIESKPKSNLTITYPKIKTTSEAMAVLKRTRKKLLKLGRDIAWKLTENGGTVTTRDVAAVMVAEGLYPKDVPAVWLGALFNTPEWKWTGKYAQYAVPTTAKHTHAWRTVKIWQRA